ncbi:MAG: transcription antitermination factor NusB [Chitinophagales bacterium]
MINRRSVRVKTMQALYAFQSSDTQSTSDFEQYLIKSIQSVKEQYLFILLYIREIANYVEHDAHIKAKKYIQTETDKQFSTKLLSNTFVQYLNHNEEFQKEIKKSNTQLFINVDEVRKFYKKFSETATYKKYLQNDSEFNIEEDQKIISFLFNTVLLEDEHFLEIIEEFFINWNDDALLVVDAVREAIKKSKNELALHIGKQNVKSKIDELTKFGKDLFFNVIHKKEEYIGLIEPKLKNWETDRLAMLDVLIMRMALSEFIDFPSIPVKVTMNEYLDIAREYSTSKSKDFINGVLDKIMQELKAKNQLNKTGRGLL